MVPEWIHDMSIQSIGDHIHFCFGAPLPREGEIGCLGIRRRIVGRLHEGIRAPGRFPRGPDANSEVEAAGWRVESGVQNGFPVPLGDCGRWLPG